jgi:hypothetical protein
MSARVLTLFPWPQLSQDSFGAFWQMYPRRVSRHEAQRAWGRLTPQERIECLRVLPLHLEQWERNGTEDRFIPHASTWLNQRRFEDEFKSAPDLGRCDWNKNGTRDPASGQCEHRACHTDPENGNVYCQAHAVSRGIPRKRRA